MLIAHACPDHRRIARVEVATQQRSNVIADMWICVMIASWIETARRWHNERRAVEALAALSDERLLDIGLDRGNLQRAVRCGLADRG